MNKKDILKNMKKMKEEYLDEEKIDKIKDITKKYEDKSEDDIFVEIIKLNGEMKEDMGEEEYNSMFEKLDNIRPLLSEEQIEKLDKVLEIIDKKEKV